MKKCFLIVPVFVFCAGTIFSEIALSPAILLSPSIDSRFGFLLYEKDASSWFHTERLDAVLKTPVGSFSLGGRYLYGDSPHALCSGSLHAGSVDFAFSRNFYTVRAGGGAFSFPDTIQVISREATFKVQDFDGLFATLGGTIDFCLCNEEWSVTTDILFGKAGIKSGDMYYFYGNPDHFFLFGGKTTLSMPYGFTLFGFGGVFSADLHTDKNQTVGKLDAGIASAFAAKTFLFPLLDVFSVKPFVGYVYLSVAGDTMLTSASQTYALFPYKYIGGEFTEGIHFLSVGNSFALNKGGFAFSLDFLWLFCFKNTTSGTYLYQFKKNIFFDGSSDSGNLPLPDTTGIHIFAGIAEVSYKLVVHKHFSPTVRLTKMIAATILNQKTSDFLHTAFSSYSTVSSPTPDDSSNASSFGTEMLKRILLSGTSVSVKIEM